MFCLQKQLAQFDAETQEKVAQAELDALPSLEVKHAHARLELRERQLQELAGTMNELSTEEVSYCFLNLSCEWINHKNWLSITECEIIPISCM